MMFKYTAEMKNRFSLIILSWLLSASIAYYYKGTLLFLSLKTLINGQTNNEIYFIATNLTEILSAYLKLSYFIANVVTLIVAIYHLLIFLSPGLYKWEHFNLKHVAIKGTISGIFSLIMINKYIMALCWKFFLGFQKPDVHNSVSLYFEGKICEYIEFYVLICIVCMISSQLTVYLFLYLDFIKKKVRFVKNYRKLFYIIFLILATLVTPPDVWSQITILFLFLITYELIVVITVLKKFLIR